MLSDFSVDRLPMIVIVRERVMNRREGKMGIMLKKLLRSLSVQQCGNNNRSDSDPGALNPRAAPADCGVTDDVRVGYGRHG